VPKGADVQRKSNACRSWIAFRQIKSAFVIG